MILNQNLCPLQMINAVTDIQEDTLVELVINSQPLSDEDVEIRPHSLAIHSYKTPTFCHFCGEMLFGMFKQVKIKLNFLFLNILQSTFKSGLSNLKTSYLIYPKRKKI